MKAKKYLFLLIIIGLNYFSCPLQGQNSIVGDGFGGRGWYVPCNYSVGSYTGYVTCGSDSQLYAWGDNITGMLGNGTNTPNPKPQKSIGMTKVKFLTSGYLTAAIKSDNTGWTWGTPLMDYNQTKLYNLTPIKILDSVMHCDAGQNTVGFVKSDGTVWHYGLDKFGQSGSGGIPNLINGPKLLQMKNMNNAVRVAVSDLVTAVLTKNGDVYVTGTDVHSNLGMKNVSYTAYTPVKNTYLKDIVDIKAANMGFCALDKNGFVYTWGQKAFGFIGGGDTSNGHQNVPLKNPVLKNIIAISGCNDGWHFMALDSAKNCYAWGMNLKGSCATPMSYTTLYPQLVATDVIDIMAGESFSLIVKSDGSLWCTGGSGWASIWLNLKDSNRANFTKVDPTAAGFDLCMPKFPNSKINYILSLKKSGICEDEQITFTATSTPKSPSNRLKYFVFNATRYQGESCTLVVNNPGNYSVRYFEEDTAANTTDSTDYSFTVYPKPKTRILINDSVQCINSNMFIHSFTTPNVSLKQFKWIFHNEQVNNVSPYSKTYSATGIYPVKLILTSDSGCIDSFQSRDVVVPRPKANFTFDIDYANASFPKLTTFNRSNPRNVKLYYDFGKFGNAYRDTSLQSTAFDNFVAKLTITDSNNCTDTFSKSIVFKSFKRTYYYMPTAFTPNGDALNPTYGPVFSIPVDKFNFKIYNRWGGKIYEGNDIAKGWNGTYMNKPCQEGMYVYMIKFVDSNSKPYFENGTFLLMRK